MKNTRKNTISEAAAEAMGLGGYPQSAGGSDRDMSGKGSMIPSPVVAGTPAVAANIGVPGIPASTPHTARAGMASPKAQEHEDEESETEEAEEHQEEGGEDEPVETEESYKMDFHNALMSLLGEDVSPTLVNQIEAVFEAAVTDRVERTVASIVESVDGNVKGYLDNVTESLVEKVDDYLDYVVEEWMTENAVAVEQGIKTQIAENFIGGLKNLFENHYIDVPAEKYNVLDELYASNRELEAKLNEAVKYNMDLKKEVSLTECAGIFVAETRDLADTQVVKLQNLMENVAFASPEEYREKLVAIRENYLRTRPSPARTSEPEQTFAAVKQTPSTLVESYVGALGRLNKKV
jgi:hypothetical protein